MAPERRRCHQAGPAPGRTASIYQLNQPALQDFSAITFSQDRPPQLARPRRRFGGHGWLDSIAPFAGSSEEQGTAPKTFQNGLPKAKHLFDSVRNAIFRPPVSVNRSQLLRLSGWSFAKGVPLGPTTPAWLILEDRSTGKRYYGNLGQREARVEVAALFRSVPESCTLCSGFSVWAEVGPLPSGTYRIGMAYANENRSIVVMFRQRICLV